MRESEKKAVIETAQEMSRKGLVVGTAGNVSLRVSRLKRTGAAGHYA
jgi:ribulose-5-phosphate 4-epimerase/fuculose-1-phosphate aldolase